jgi:hypothetical protein
VPSPRRKRLMKAAERLQRKPYRARRGRSVSGARWPTISTVPATLIASQPKDPTTPASWPAAVARVQRRSRGIQAGCSNLVAERGTGGERIYQVNPLIRETRVHSFRIFTVILA